VLVFKLPFRGAKSLNLQTAGSALRPRRLFKPWVVRLCVQSYGAGMRFLLIGIALFRNGADGHLLVPQTTIPAPILPTVEMIL